jgi:HEAT repeat protein
MRPSPRLLLPLVAAALVAAALLVALDGREPDVTPGPARDAFPPVRVPTPLGGEGATTPDGPDDRWLGPLDDLPLDAPPHVLAAELDRRFSERRQELAARLGARLSDAATSDEDLDRLLAVLAVLGADAAPALDALVALVEGDGEHADDASYVIARMGAAASPAVPRLAVVFESRPTEGVGLALARAGRGGADELLRVAGGLADDRDVEILVNVLKHADPEVTVPAVAAYLDRAVRVDGDLEERLLEVLGETGDPSACDVVIARLGADEDLHDAALDALAHLGPDAGRAVPALVRLLDGTGPDDSVGILLDAVVATARKDGVAASALGRLLQRDAMHADSAARALHRLGPGAAVATDALVGALGGSLPVRMAVLDTLFSMGGGGLSESEVGKVSAAVAEGLADGAPADLRSSALRGAAALGPAGQTVLPRVREIASTATSRVDRLLARFAELRISGNVAALENEIRICLDDPDPDVRDAACQIAGRMGLQAASLVPDMAKLLTRGDQKDLWAWPAILETFEGLGPAAAAGRDATREFLEAGASTGLREMRTLMAIGVPDEEAVERWSRLLDSIHADHRAAACEALGELGAAAVPARPRLRLAALDDDWRVRRAAERALARIP